MEEYIKRERTNDTFKVVNRLIKQTCPKVALAEEEKGVTLADDSEVLNGTWKEYRDWEDLCSATADRPSDTMRTDGKDTGIARNYVYRGQTRAVEAPSVVGSGRGVPSPAD